MADLTTRIPIDPTWAAGDRLRLYLGDENVASLDDSTPTGGSIAVEDAIWPDGVNIGGLGTGPLGDEPLGESEEGYGLGEGELGEGPLGDNDAPRRVLNHTYRPQDKCAVLPIGVTTVDPLGNEAAVIQRLVQLNDPPRGVRDLDVSPTENTGEALLTWSASPDV